MLLKTSNGRPVCICLGPLAVNEAQATLFREGCVRKHQNSDPSERHVAFREPDTLAFWVVGIELDVLKDVAANTLLAPQLSF